MRFVYRRGTFVCGSFIGMGLLYAVRLSAWDFGMRFVYRHGTFVCGSFIGMGLLYVVRLSAWDFGMRFVYRHGTLVCGSFIGMGLVCAVCLSAWDFCPNRPDSLYDPCSPYKGLFPVNKPAGSQVRPAPKLRMNGAAPPFPICLNEAHRNSFVF